MSKKYKIVHQSKVEYKHSSVLVIPQSVLLHHNDKNNLIKLYKYYCCDFNIYILKQLILYNKIRMVSNPINRHQLRAQSPLYRLSLRYIVQIDCGAQLSD